MSPDGVPTSPSPAKAPGDLVAFFALAYGVSWLLWSPLWLPALGFDRLPVLPYHHALGALGPITAALVVSARSAGPAGPGDLFRRMVAWRGRLVWVATGLLAPIALLLVAAVLASILSDEPFRIAEIGRSSEFPRFTPMGFLLYNVFSFGYGEEVGWRGFALPRLQARHSALGATLILSLGWALWHVPLFLYRPGFTGMGVAGAAGWFFSLLTGAVLLTWLYNESRGSLLAVALFHASMDVVFTSDVASAFVVNATGALITVSGVVVLVVAGPRYLSRKGKMVRRERDPVARLVERT